MGECKNLRRKRVVSIDNVLQEYFEIGYDFREDGAKLRRS
jgi:hypothetical protein